MNKNKYYLLTGLSAILLSVVGVTSITLAGQRFHREDLPEGEASQERRQAEAAFENYEDWAAMMNERADMLEEQAGKIRQNINQEYFEKTSQVYQLMQEGNFEEAKSLQEELGMPIGPMGKMKPCDK